MRTCVITKMSLSAKGSAWKLSWIEIDVYKKIKLKDSRKDKLIYWKFLSHLMDSFTYQTLKRSAEDCLSKINLEDFIAIKLN